MLISELTNRDDVMSSIIKELNAAGIKIQNEKKKQQNNKRRNKKIFNISLHLLELDDGLLSNGSVAQIPKFVLQSCKRIQMELDTVGIFRKTGSVKKQKLLQEHLEKGGSIDKSHNVLDVANLLKTFFRELPEPLIPAGAVQEGLLRCLIHFSSYEEKCEALMMLMLLLPPISVNTLAYFLQFLEVVIKNSATNLMSTDNLVKVLTPTLMPVPSNAPQKRLMSHFKVIELLIENANLLGVVPDRMLKKDNLPVAPSLTEEQKKKKRRSRSVNRMFNGFRKIVGAIGSSSESLDKSEELLEEDPTATAAKNKKRPLDKLDMITSNSKKKKDILMTLTSLPENDDVNSPSAKNETLKKRKSLGDHKESSSPAPSPTKRRWSIVGGKFSRGKSAARKSDETILEDQVDHSMDDNYVKVSKSEYEAFKDRLNSIETKISHEFNLTKLDAVKAEMGQDDSHLITGPEKVQNKYHQTLQEVGKLEESERKTEQLARRLSRDLKIRPSIEHGVVRSPSARKIGSLRRRRDSATRLSRNQSWHMGQSSPKLSTKQGEPGTSQFISTASFYPKSNLKRAKPVQTVHVPSARPLPALPPVSQQPEKIVPEKPLRVKRESSDPFVTPSKTLSQVQELWTPATDFFNDSSVKAMEVEPSFNQQTDDMFFKTPVRPKRLSSSRSTTKTENDSVKTPMLPPRLTPAKGVSSMSTPMRPLDFSMMNKSVFHTPSLNDASSQGRESIIILRNRNAGMVAQKAKLFNGLTEQSEVSKPVKIPRVIVNKKLEHVKNMSLDETPSKKRGNNHLSRSPRKSPRSPVGISKRSASSTLKTIREAGGNQKAQWMKPEFLNEIASPKRKPLTNSNSNTPRRKSKTPSRDSAKKRRQTPSKSPRFIHRVQTQDPR